MSILYGDKIYLKILSVEDVSDAYVSWMNDYEIVKYTESRFYPQTKEAVKQFVIRMGNENNTLFGIFTKNNKAHIGNIKLGSINWIHRYADIGIIIGDKEYWGQGIATEAIGLVVEYAFKQLNLHKLIAAAYQYNTGTVKAFKKNGFVEEYIEKEKYFFEGNYIDCIFMGKINDRR